MNRALVITGASTGIGLATALAASREGFAVYAGVRNDNDAARLAEIDRVTPLNMDVTNPPSLAAAAQRVGDDGIALAGVICNAGIAFGGPIESIPLDEWRQQFDVNCVGAVATVQAFLPMLRATRGHIVLVGSVSGRVAFPYLAPYGASKFALRAIADALRVEVAPAGVTVTLVEPGSVRTPIWAKGRAATESMRARITSHMPAYYRRAIDALDGALEDGERTGMPVERVADSILWTLSRRRPPAYRILGAGAKAAAYIGLLPPRLRDRVLRRMTRVP